MTKLDLKTLLKYVNQWIGLSSDRSQVLVAGRTLIDVNKQLKKLKVKDPIITYVMPPDQYIAPICQF